MIANWTTLYIKLNEQMKRIGNVNLKTKDIRLYIEGHNHYKSDELYYVDSNGDYQQYHK